MLAGTLSSIVESIGDYYAVASICDVKRPPAHAINRGIMIEGFGCIIAALWGTGNGTTSYSENIAVIQLTKIGSRAVVVTAAIILLILGMFIKISAIFVSIPAPIIGGMFMTMFGMITAVGLSNLRYISLTSSRNLLILGLGLYFGLGFPAWMAGSTDGVPNKNQLKTDILVIDNVVEVILSTSMFLGGMVALILDLVIPGTKEERGLASEDMEIILKNSPRNYFKFMMFLKFFYG